VRRQVCSQPSRLLLCLPDDKLDDDLNWSTHFLPLWNKVRELILLPSPGGIDSITDALVAQGFITLGDDYEALLSARELVFAILGWQTMLYKPDFASYSTGAYNILDEMDGYHGDARICLSQSALSGTKKLPEFLLGFGMMLPPRNYCAMDDTDDRALFSQTKAIRSKDLEAHVLTKVCGIRLRWVDSLSCHLELDRPSGTLYIFRHPSFCLSSLQKHGGKCGQKSILHQCALERSEYVSWANDEDVTEFLQEILLSYRLIFGQNKKSRAVFRRLQPSAGILEEQDKVLAQLCGRKRLDCPITLIEREEYELAADFPHLRSKIVRLYGYSLSRKPRSLRQMWRDTRDSTAWVALWSVLIFGSLSLVLGFIQTIFQILQYVDGHGQ